jgi:hypothetical protein
MCGRIEAARVGCRADDADNHDDYLAVDLGNLDRVRAAGDHALEL